MAIKEIKNKPNPNVIKVLEQVLEEAKNGDVQAVAIAGVTGNCESFNCFDGSYYPNALLGEIRLLEREVIDIHCQTRRKVAWEYTE